MRVRGDGSRAPEGVRCRIPGLWDSLPARVGPGATSHLRSTFANLHAPPTNVTPAQPPAMTDPVASLRQKTRFVVEMRFDVVPTFFDTKGEFIARTHPLITARFPHWRANYDQVLFTEDLDHPVNQFLVSHKQVSVMLEDVPLQEFADEADTLLGLAFDGLSKGLRKVSRCGVRFMGILNAKQASYEATKARALSEFHNNYRIDLPLEVVDSQAIIVHKYGRFGVGPTKRDDLWTKSVFQKPDKNVPEFGFALDVDSFAGDIAVGGRDAFITAFHDVLDLTVAVEQAIAARLGLVDAAKATA